ncbi:hypothetical protein [Atopobium fossor]|uniref:hypothetical protein n=1 Tax=Atopobium fossor TaxID=39487 RepID=UPI000422497E|nr:hypothetical protein [Atopobium fossor]
MPGYRELCRAIKSCGIRYARIAWDTADGSSPPPLPYALLVPNATSDRMAANSNVFAATHYTVELYERGSDMQLESKLEKALSGAGFTYVRRCVPLGGGVVEMTYTLTVVGR